MNQAFAKAAACSVGTANKGFDKWRAWNIIEAPSPAQSIVLVDNILLHNPQFVIASVDSIQNQVRQRDNFHIN
jgi:hypothetical protein